MADSKEIKRVLLGPLLDNNPIALRYWVCVRRWR